MKVITLDTTTTGLEGLTMDSDYGYIYTFMQYLNMLINMIINAFKKLSSSDSDSTEGDAD